MRASQIRKLCFKREVVPRSAYGIRFCSKSVVQLISIEKDRRRRYGAKKCKPAVSDYEGLKSDLVGDINIPKNQSHIKISDSENAFRGEKKVKRFSARIREFLPQPRRLCFHWRQFVFCLLFVCQQDYPKTTHDGKRTHGPGKKQLDFGGNSDHVT